MLKRRRPTVRVPLLRKLSYARSMAKKVKEYRIIYSASGVEDGYKTFLLTIPSKSIKHFRNSEYNPDVHGCQRVPGFSHFLAHTSKFAFGKPVLIDSTIYTLAMEEVTFGESFELRLLTLDLTSQRPEWEPLLPPRGLFEVKVNCKSVLLAIRGCLYVLRAYTSFGVVFNPRTRRWGELKSHDIDSRYVTLIASLGDSVAKILVHQFEYVGLDSANSFIHLYDVVSESWFAYSDNLLRDVNIRIPKKIDNPLVLLEPGNSPTLYFMNYWGMLYAFDCRDMQLFEGPILGFDEANLRETLDRCHSFASFLHFGGDLFCLCCSTSHITQQEGWRTWFHYIFIRATKLHPDSTPSLKAYIVGCLEDFIDGDFRHDGAFFI